jgi:hypothetical protein
LGGVDGCVGNPCGERERESKTPYQRLMHVCLPQEAVSLADFASATSAKGSLLGAGVVALLTHSSTASTCLTGTLRASWAGDVILATLRGE